MRSTAHRALISTFLGFATLGLAFAPSAARAQDDLSTPDEEEEEEAKDKDYRFEFGLYGGYHFFEDKHGLRADNRDDELWSPRDGGRSAVA